LALSLLVLLTAFFSNSGKGDLHLPRGEGTYRPILARGDGHMMYLMTRSLVLDGDLVWDNDLARFGDPWRQPRTETGRKMIPHPIGPPLLWTPFFAAAHGTSKLANLFGAEIPSHGYTLYHQRFTFFTSPLFAWLAVLIGFRVARKWIGGRWAPVHAAVAVLFGTSLTYYATFGASYAHAVDALACAGFLGTWAVTLGDLRWRRFVLLGGLLGLCALVRITGFSLGVVVAIELAARLARPTAGERRGRLLLDLLLRGLTALGVAVLVFTPQMLAWKIVFGELLVSPMGPAFIQLDRPKLWETLFSSRNGWLSWHPLAYAGLLGLAVVPRRARLIAAGFLAVLILQVWVNASVYDWWSGASFGQRRMCSVTLILVFGLAALIAAAGRAARRTPLLARHLVAAVVLGWFVAWNVVLIANIRGRKGSANAAMVAMCCERIPRAMRWIARPIYRRVGNPFALPASLLLAIRHRVPPKRWDLVVGHYADLPTLADLNEGRHQTRQHTWSIAEAAHSPYLVRGFGPPQKEGKQKFRWTVASEAVALVPLFMSDARIVTVTVRPNVGAGDEPMRVELGWNGRVYADRQLGPGSHSIELLVPASGLAVGINEFFVRAEPRTLAVGSVAPPPRPAGRPVGVAIGRLKLSYPPR
jgi:hypothetical protein